MEIKISVKISREAIRLATVLVRFAAALMSFFL